MRKMENRTSVYSGVRIPTCAAGMQQPGSYLLCLLSLPIVPEVLNHSYVLESKKTERKKERDFARYLTNS